MTRVVLAVLFAALLASPLIYKRIIRMRQTAEETQGRERALAHYGFVMTESSQSAGIQFTHKAPVLDRKLNHIMEQVASMGAAVSVVDFDHDGWDDLYVVNSGEDSRNALFKNLGNGTFRDVAEQVGIADVNQQATGVSMGAVWGDYDNDGYEDLLLYKWGKPELFHNDGGTRFTRITEQASLPPWVNANTAIWFDYDRDGKLDFFLGGYYPEKINLWKLGDTRIMPESFEYAQNGGRKYLFHNLGGGRFEEVSEKLGITSRRWALATVAADFRGTGYPDLFVANDYGVSELYFNDHGKSFKEMGRDTGVGYAPKSGMTASVGDVLNQGRYSIFVSNISEEGVLVQGNNLWMPKPGTSGDGIRFENLANSMGVELGGWSFGAQFGDLNNDGYLDLYEVNGNVSLNQDQSYWYDYSKVAGGNRTIISDAANWPSLKGRSLSGYQQKKVWINDGAGQFKEVSQMVGVKDRFDGRAIVLADLNNDGSLDAVIANQRGPLLLYRNQTPATNHWIEFALEGRASNRSAIGAEVRVFWNGQQQVQEVSGGSGFCSQNPRRLHFGLGTSAAIDKVEIHWPSGRLQKLNSPKPDQIQKVVETHLMAQLSVAPPGAFLGRGGSPVRSFFSAENRYLPPIFITLILLVGQLSFGLLESASRTTLAIAASIACEIGLSLLVYRKFPHLASAYISGISVGILLRSPEFWPYALCSVLAILSKYVIRWHGRHLWNPSNFAITAMLLLAPEYVATLSVQWGNAIWPMMIVWLLGLLIVFRVNRAHITATYVIAFVVLAFVRTLFTGHPFLAEVAPITGPMYQLFIFFMITDPKTTVRSSRRAQCLVVILVTLAEFMLRLAQNIHAPYYALAIVGPAAVVAEILWTRSKAMHSKVAQPA